MNNYTTVPQDYAMIRVMHHVDTQQGKRYVVKWYRYGPRDDSLSQKSIYPNILSKRY